MKVPALPESWQTLLPLSPTLRVAVDEDRFRL